MIFTGAKVEAKAEVSEAMCMKLLAEKEGVPSEFIILEEKAQNTIENAYYTKNLLLDKLAPPKGKKGKKKKKKDKEKKEEKKQKTTTKRGREKEKGMVRRAKVIVITSDYHGERS